MEAWTFEDTKQFEVQLAAHYHDADRFKKIANALPNKSVADIKRAFASLEEDVTRIEGEVRMASASGQATKKPRTSSGRETRDGKPPRAAAAAARESFAAVAETLRSSAALPPMCWGNANSHNSHGGGGGPGSTDGRAQTGAAQQAGGAHSAAAAQQARSATHGAAASAAAAATNGAAAGPSKAPAAGAAAASGNDRRKGVPWTQEEHKLFLRGLAKFGKGSWRSIARQFVMTRTPTQVASHAQKYFLRLNSAGEKKDKRRASIHDITTDHVVSAAELAGMPRLSAGVPASVPQ